jgi:type VI secretion system secreted protein Hcp
MPIYMNVDGVQGDVTATGHENWIEVKSFEWGVGRGITMPVGGSKDREASVPSVSEVMVTKDSDVATADLLKKALTGDAVTVKFDFCMTGTSQFTPYYQFELTNVLLSGYSLNSGGDRPMESLSLNFTKVQFSDYEISDKNDPGSPVRVTYDLSTGTSS